MDQNTIFLFIITSVTLTLFPGPDIMYVISTSLAKGWKKGVLFSFGLCSGLIIHTLVVVLGLGSILKSLPQAIRIIELLGASYLLFIAYRLLKSSYLFEDNSIKKEISENIFLTGFIMNLSNPKVTLFFISFFPGFLFSEILSYKIQFLILGIIFFIQALIIFTSISIIVDQLGQNLKFYKEQFFWNKIQAAVLFIISIILIYP
jgi:threonine/homoserine/homoserine lactone efflux protein